MIDPRDGPKKRSIEGFSVLRYKHRSCEITFANLRVVLHAFLGKVRTWYTWRSNEQDELMLFIAPDPQILDSLPKPKYLEPGPMKKYVEDLPFEEFRIDGDIEKELGLDLAVFGTRTKQSGLIKYKVEFRDLETIVVEPVDFDLLRELVHCILRQYSYYLSIDIDWSGILEILAQTLWTNGEIWMTEPIDEIVKINVKRTETRFIPSCLSKFDSLYVSTKGGVAVFIQ
jgi:hypothetical protein